MSIISISGEIVQSSIFPQIKIYLFEGSIFNYYITANANEISKTKSNIIDRIRLVISRQSWTVVTICVSLILYIYTSIKKIIR